MTGMIPGGAWVRSACWELPRPPVTSTRPSCRRAAAWFMRDDCMLDTVGVKPVVSPYTSALASGYEVASRPPAMSTVPSASAVSVWQTWGVTIGPTSFQASAPGS